MKPTLPKEEMLLIDPLKFSEDTFTLSYIADDIDYIILEDTLLFNSVYSMRINSFGILMSTKEHGLLLFNPGGKFIKVIAKKGRGPEEFLFGHNFAIDEKGEKIFVSDNGKIRVYSLNGNFIRDITTENYISGSAGQIEFFNSSLFLADYGTYGEFKYNWIVLDTLGNLLSQKKSLTRPPGFMQRGKTYIYDNKLFYYNYLNDTIFSISTDWNTEAAYYFSQGDFRWRDDIDLNITPFEQMRLFFKPGNMVETNKFIFLEYSFRDKWSILLIDKKTKKTFQGYKEEKRGILNYVACISNDLDGGLPFLPHPVFNYNIKKGDESILTLIFPYELKAHINSDAFKNSTPKYPEKKRELEQLANSLNEYDNPVLMLVKLKN